MSEASFGGSEVAAPANDAAKILYMADRVKVERAGRRGKGCRVKFTIQ